MVILTPYVLDVVVHAVENLALLTLLNTFEEYFCFDQRSSKILSCDVHSYVFNYFPDITEPNQTTPFKIVSESPHTDHPLFLKIEKFQISQKPL